MADFSGGNENLLKRLEEGEESDWDFIATLAESGEITIKSAINSLAKCLAVVKYEYETWSKDPKNPQDYWKERAEDAGKALSKIFDAKELIVNYRGFSIRKNQDYDVSSLIN